MKMIYYALCLLLLVIVLMTYVFVPWSGWWLMATVLFLFVAVFFPLPEEPASWSDVRTYRTSGTQARLRAKVRHHRARLTR